MTIAHAKISTLVTGPLVAPLIAPWISFTMPRLPYDVVTDEIIVTNGSLSAAFVSNGPSSYFPSQLRRILAHRFCLNNNDQGTLVIWGFDDQGYHAVLNQAFAVDYSVKGVVARTDHIESEDGHTNSNWHTTFEYRVLPGTRVLLATVTYQNVSAAAHPLKLAFNLLEPQISRNDHWDWWNPGPGQVSATFDRSLASGAVVTSNSHNDAFLLFGLTDNVASYSVTNANEWTQWRDHGTFAGNVAVVDAWQHAQYLSHDFGIVKPGDRVSVSAVVSIAGTLASARDSFVQAVDHAAEDRQAAATYWDTRRTATPFTVLTPDPDIDRMSEVALANAMTSWDEINNSWVTAFSENARGCNYLWDNGYAGYAFLISNPPRVKDTLRKLLSLDWHNRYAYSIPDASSVGVYYAYNHATLIELVYRYVTMTGDRAFLNEMIPRAATPEAHDSVLSILQANVAYIQELAFNFGDLSNLLEVVPNYIHEVPDLVAATAKMAREVSGLAAAAGHGEMVATMDSIATTAQDRLQALWDANAQWFRTGDGHLVYTGQIFNMIYTGTLSQAQIDGILRRLPDFMFEYGVRSLADYDPDYRQPSVARGDWDGPGSYIGNAGNMMRALAAAGRSKELYQLARGVAQWFKWRPWQPQGIEATTGKGLGSIAENTTNSAESRYLEVVPFQMLGLTYTLDGIEIHEALPREWTNATGPIIYLEQSYALAVKIPYLGYAYTFYVDKPRPEDATFRYASLYDANGQHIQDVRTRLLPPLRQDLTVILHFGE